MATIYAFGPVDMNDPEIFYGYLLEATSRRIVVSDGYATAIYHGYNFRYAYDGTVTGGTLTGYDGYEGDVLTVSFTGLSVPARLAFDLLSDGDVLEFLSIALAGDDVVIGSDYRDELQGFDGDDAIGGYAGDDRLDGGLGDDYLEGGTGRDVLIGGGGHDVLNGGSGADWLYGGAGLDLADYYDSAAAVTVNLGTGTGRGGHAAGDVLAGIEDVDGSAYADVITGNGGGNWLAGGGGDDQLSGLGGADRLRGDAGNDVLNGGSGDDRLIGGPGQDRLTGGAGADFFDFDRVTHSSAARPDSIGDFVRGVDRIDLSGIDADTDGTAGDQAFTFIGSRAFSGVDGQLRFAGGLVSGDTDGDRRADFSIAVDDVTTLAGSDFIL